LKWFLKAMAAVAGGVLLLAGSLWLVKDSDWLRETITAQLSMKLGRQVSLTAWQVSLGVNTTVTLQGLEVAQPEGFGTESFARVESATASANIADLLAPPFQLTSLEASGVDLHLEQHTDGRNNWTFGSKSGEPTDDALADPVDLALPLLVEQGVLSNLTVVFVDANQQSRRIEGNIELAGTPSGIDLRIAGNVNGHSIGATITGRSEEAITTLKNVRLLVDANLEEVTLQGQGNFRDLLDPNRPELTLRVDGPSVEYVTERLQVAPISQGPLNLDIAVQPSGELMAVRVDGLIGEFSAVVNGQFNNLRTLDEGELALAVSGPNIRMLGALIGSNELPPVPFSISARAQRTGPELVIRDARLNAGRLGVSAAGSIPSLEQPTYANLKATINLPAIEVFRDIFQLPNGVNGPVEASITVDASSKQSDVTASLTSRFGELELQGYLSTRPDLAGSVLDINAQGQEVAELLALTGVNTIGSGPWRLATTLTVTPAHIEMSQATLAIPGAEGEFSVSVDRDLPGESALGQVSAQVADLRQLVQPWLPTLENPEYLPAVPLTATTNFSWRSGELNLDGLRLALPDLELSGSAFASPADNAVTGQLALEGKNLSHYIPTELVPEQVTLSRLDEALKLQSDVALSGEGLAIDNLTLEFADLRLSGQSSINGEQLHLELEGAMGDAFLWVEDEPDALAADGLPINLRVNLDRNAGDIVINDLEVTSGTGSDLRARGALQMGESFAGSGLSVDLAIVDLARLGILLGQPLPSVPLVFDADFEGNERRLKASKFFLASGDTEFSGALEITDPDHPNVQLALRAPMVDLRPFLTPPGEKSAEDTPEDGTSSEKPAKSARNRRLIPDIPLDLSVLSTFEADVDIQIDKLVGHTRRLKNLVLDAKVKAGRLLLTEASGTDETRGDLVFAGFAVPGDNTSHIGLDLDGEDINLGFPARNPDEVQLLPRFNIVGEVFSSGNTLRELLGGLNGALQITAGEGRVSSQASGLLVNSFIDELLSLVNPLRRDQDFTEVQCLVALADVKDGKLKGDPLATVVTDKLAIVGKAQVDLTTEKLFLTFNTIPQRGLGISASSAFKPFVGVAGTLARPQLTLDPEGTVIQGSLAVLTGGISLIGKSVIDRFTVSKKSCNKAEQGFADERSASEANYFAFRDNLLPTEESLTTP